MIKVKRIYASPTPEPGDGKRILIDRLWPRGLRKEASRPYASTSGACSQAPPRSPMRTLVTSPDRAANLAAYADPSLPLAHAVIDEIADFIHGAPERH